jgi:hypothetical protein
MHEREQAVLKQGVSAVSDGESENVNTVSEQVMEVVRTMVADSITNWILKGKPTFAGALAAQGAFENEHIAQPDA